MDVKSKAYTYRTRVRWAGERKGSLSAEGKPDLVVATPPEFKGHPGIWSPEDLFVSAVNICTMSTFLAFAERAGFAFHAYESEAEGRLELLEGKFTFTAVTLRPKLTLAPGGDPAKAKELLEKAEAACLISNSITARVTLEPTIVEG